MTDRLLQEIVDKLDSIIQRMDRILEANAGENRDRTRG
jgi:hypothetical protein